MSRLTPGGLHVASQFSKLLPQITTLLLSGLQYPETILAACKLFANVRVIDLDPSILKYFRLLRKGYRAIPHGSSSWTPAKVKHCIASAIDSDVCSARKGFYMLCRDADARTHQAALVTELEWLKALCPEVKFELGSEEKEIPAENTCVMMHAADDAQWDYCLECFSGETGQAAGVILAWASKSAASKKQDFRSGLLWPRNSATDRRMTCLERRDDGFELYTTPRSLLVFYPPPVAPTPFSAWQIPGPHNSKREDTSIAALMKSGHKQSTLTKSLGFDPATPPKGPPPKRSAGGGKRKKPEAKRPKIDALADYGIVPEWALLGS